MTQLIRFSLVLMLSLLATLPSFATPPQTLNYQGYLTNPGGTPVNTPVVMTFRLYNAASGGIALYTESQPSVNVSNGSFNAIIGTVTPIPLPFDVPYWLSVQVNADAEMSPRQPLASSPYAFRAASLDAAATIDGAQITGTINALGNIVLPQSTSTSVGNIMKGANTFIHNFGSPNNTFIGLNAGNFTMTGAYNTASGRDALTFNTTGFNNTAIGSYTLSANTTGHHNTACGEGAVNGNTTGSFNTVSGAAAFIFNTTGSNNTASGFKALFFNTTGNNNTAIGVNAGYNQTIGSGNIYIGNEAVDGESNTIRIGSGGGFAGNHLRFFAAGIRAVTTGVANAIPVMIDSQGQLGTFNSSRRVKDNIADMNEASDVLMNLRPVTFFYKSDQNPAGRSLQYGLIAEEVAEIAPGLVAHSANGEIETVFYQNLPPMLLNEFQKQQRMIATQASELAQQRVRIAELEQRSADLETLKRDMLNIKALLGAN